MASLLGRDVMKVQVREGECRCVKCILREKAIGQGLPEFQKIADLAAHWIRSTENAGEISKDQMPDHEELAVMLDSMSRPEAASFIRKYVEIRATFRELIAKVNAEHEKANADWLDAKKAEVATPEDKAPSLD